MQVLLVGAGVIGTVYGAQLATAGHSVAVLEHGPRTEEVGRVGLVARDVLRGATQTARVRVVAGPGAEPYDLVVVSVWADQIQAVTESLQRLSGAPVVLFFGNNPGGRSALGTMLPGPVQLGFPGVGGSMKAATAEYTHISQQPTTLEDGGGRFIDEFGAALSSQGFAVKRTRHMDGWLAYHAVFVAAIAAALYRCHGNAVDLADDRATLALMCRAIEEGFGALRREGVEGLPGNLRTLHLAVLRPVAVRYWARMMRSPSGEQIFAAHARHAEPEMQALATAVLGRLNQAPDTSHLRRLLTEA